MIQPTPRQAVIIAAAIWVSLGGGCSSPAPTTCPNDYPTSCPDAAPSFAIEVGPLVHTHCTVCHGRGQQMPALQDYTDIMAAGTRIFSQIHACLMPPPTRTPLTPAERQAILDWLVCGAPDN